MVALPDWFDREKEKRVQLFIQVDAASRLNTGIRTSAFQKLNGPFRVGSVSSTDRQAAV